MKIHLPLFVLTLLSAGVGWTAEPASLPRALDVPGVHSYAQKIVAAGDTLQFRTSATVPYELSICRLGPKIDDPSSDEVLKTFPISAPTPQPIHPGSFVHVDKPLSADEPLTGLSLEVWVRPWSVTGWQTLISQHNYPVHCGFGLFLDADGNVQFYLGDGADYRSDWTLTGPKLEARHWQHVVGTWDGKTKSLWVDGKLVGRQAFEGPVKPGPAPLWLGACGHDGPAVNLLEGDLAMPVIYGRALSPEEIQARFQQQGLEPASGDGLLACWPLDEERGDRIADTSPHARHGRIVNTGTWMIGGPSFDGSEVPRYSEYDPAQDARRGHGLRLASDDYYDCHWKVTEEYQHSQDRQAGTIRGPVPFRDRRRAPLVSRHVRGEEAARRAQGTDPGHRLHQFLAGLQGDVVCRFAIRDCSIIGEPAESPTAPAIRPPTACIATIGPASRPTSPE